MSYFGGGAKIFENLRIWTLRFDKASTRFNRFKKDNNPSRQFLFVFPLFSVLID